jgi:multidrug efflux pump subunit AcrA (membrane-fusion protein)
VKVIPVIVKKGEHTKAGTALFQAAGWIEPRPTTMSVAAMAPGIIEELLVVSGQSVEKGEAIAKLVSIDAELSLRLAQHTLEIRIGECDRAQAELTAARLRVKNPVHLRVQLADAQSNLAKSKTELAKLPFLIAAAEANLRYAKGSMESKRSAQGAISNNIVAKAENDYEVSVTTLNELVQREPNLQREVQALEGVVSALSQQMELLVDEKRHVSESEAKLHSAEAYCKEGELNVQQAKLALERSTVKAPMSGRILRIMAQPGSRVMGLEATAGQSSSTVVEMYDPHSLQVRADVRLEDISIVTQGQSVEIETASTPHKISGRVLHITSSASVQKNTIEVKIEIFEPPSTISPEMLVTATFLAPTTDPTSKPGVEHEQIFVPRELVQLSESTSFVWLLDNRSVARKRRVELVEKSTSKLVAIASGLSVTDKLITTDPGSLREGMKVHVSGDDPSIGMN